MVGVLPYTPLLLARSLNPPRTPCTHTHTQAVAPVAAMDATDSSDSDDAGGRPSGPAGGAGEEGGERQWMVAAGPKAVRIGDDFQATLPPLVAGATAAAAPPAVAPASQEGSGKGNASRASEFHDGPVDLDEDGLGSGSRMYQ